MKKFVLAATIVAGALVVPGTASAHTGGYEGTCRFSTVNDTTPGGQLGGENQWNGQINVAVVATDAVGAPAPLPISVECELKINTISQGVVLTASGTGAAVSGSQFSYTSQDGDVVELCTTVTVDGHTHDQVCVAATRTQIIPQPIIDLIILLIDTINGVIIGLDPFLCDNVIKPLSPGVPGVVDIEPGGDIYIAGEFFWDCPPYVEDPPA